MKLSTKLLSTFAACGMVLSLAACGNTTKTSSSKSEAIQSSKTTKKHTSSTESKSNKRSQSSNNASSQKGSNSSSVNGATSSSNDDKYVVTSTSENSSSNAANSSSVVKKQSSSQQATMNSTDAKNIVKEHIGNQLNNRGVAGQSTSDLPSINSIDGYTATQNGTNDWTVSGNGHTYHVTANSVTGN